MHRTKKLLAATVLLSSLSSSVFAWWPPQPQYASPAPQIGAPSVGAPFGPAMPYQPINPLPFTPPPTVCQTYGGVGNYATTYCR